MNELKEQDVKSLIERVGAHLGCGDFTYNPEYPKGRRDVCAIKHMAEDGHSYGFDQIFLVWLYNGEMKYREIANTQATKDYVNVIEINADESGNIQIKLSSGGMFSGNPWEREFAYKM